MSGEGWLDETDGWPDGSSQTYAPGDPANVTTSESSGWDFLWPPDGSKAIISQQLYDWAVAQFGKKRVEPYFRPVGPYPPRPAVKVNMERIVAECARLTLT